MNKIIFGTLLIILLSSCTTQNNKGEGVVEESGRIINDYVDTLEGSVQDTKAVTDLINKNNQDLDDTLKKIPR
ncbi:hypothetical protein A9Q91_04715 [Candidatus Gracilibacteria bacterium 28_42_T64]|nr:hypothetical protein A9Q91_04715 [Candidatus Gracilibacteria bacterium 28_42_T64]